MGLYESLPHFNLNYPMHRYTSTLSPGGREALNWQGFTCSLLTITLPHNPVPNESKSSQPVDRLQEDTIFTNIIISVGKLQKTI